MKRIRSWTKEFLVLDCIFTWSSSCSKYLHHTLFCLFCTVRSYKATVSWALLLLESFVSSSPCRPYRPLQQGRTVTAYGRSDDVHGATDVPHAGPHTCILTFFRVHYYHYFLCSVLIVIKCIPLLNFLPKVKKKSNIIHNSNLSYNSVVFEFF